jgi:hypothetical protein
VNHAELIPRDYLNALRKTFAGRILFIVDPLDANGIYYNGIPTIVDSLTKQSPLIALARSLYNIDTRAVDRKVKGSFKEIKVSKRSVGKIDINQYITNDDLILSLFAISSFARISEEIRRYLNPISYTVRRVLCMKVAAQLNKKWTEVEFDDIKYVNLPQNDILALKAILGSTMPDDISNYESLIGEEDTGSIDKYQTVEYNSIDEMLIQEMIEHESKLTDKDLRYLADMLCLDFDTLKRRLPYAMDTLYKRLKSNLDA